MSAAETKEKKPKKEKAAAPVEAAAPAPAAPVAPPAPRTPADPRLKVWKKFQGRYLPKGALRDRLKAITTRWDANEAHEGVTLEELKSLHADWKASREPGRKPKKAAAKV